MCVNHVLMLLCRKGFAATPPEVELVIALDITPFHVIMKRLFCMRWQSSVQFLSGLMLDWTRFTIITVVRTKYNTNTISDLIHTARMEDKPNILHVIIKRI